MDNTFFLENKKVSLFIPKIDREVCFVCNGNANFEAAKNMWTIYGNCQDLRKFNAFLNEVPNETDPNRVIHYLSIHNDFFVLGSAAYKGFKPTFNMKMINLWGIVSFDFGHLVEIKAI